MRSLILIALALIAAAGCSGGGGQTYEPKPKGTVDANNVEVQESGTVIHRDPGGDK